MSDERKNRLAASFEIKQLLVDELLNQSDEHVLNQAKEDGIDPSASRSRVLEAFRRAKTIIAELARKETDHWASPRVTKKPTVLNIDAAKARAILKRVANRPLGSLVPLANAARLDQISNDDEVVQTVTDLRNMGALSDDDLK